MTQRQRILVFAFVVAVAVTAFVVLARNPRRGGVLAAIPKDTFLVATLDVPSLRESPILKTLQGELGEFLSFGALTETCGFDPLSRAKEMAVALPEEQAKDFGVVASGDFTRAELTQCAEKSIAARGGKATTGTRGDFTTVEDSQASDAHFRPKLAIKDGLVLLARGPWLDAMMDASSGDAPALSENTRHTALRATLAGKLEAGAPATLTVSVLLPKETRDNIKQKMGAEVESGSNATMAGVLAVESAGAVMSLGKAESQLAVELECESDGACEEVRTLLLKERKSLLGNIRLAFTGLRPFVDSIQVTVQGRTLSGHARGETKAIAGGVDMIVKNLTEGRSQKPVTKPEEPSPEPVPSLRPDEILTLPRDGGGSAPHVRASPGPDAAH